MVWSIAKCGGPGFKFLSKEFHMKKILLALLLVIGVGSAGLFAAEEGPGDPADVEVLGGGDEVPPALEDGGFGPADPAGRLEFITNNYYYQGISGELSNHPIKYATFGILFVTWVVNKLDLKYGNDEDDKKEIARIQDAFKGMVLKGVFTDAAAEYRAILTEEWRTGNWKYVVQVSLDYIGDCTAVASFIGYLAFKFIPFGPMWGYVSGAFVGAYNWFTGLFASEPAAVVPAGPLGPEAEVGEIRARRDFVGVEIDRHRDVLEALRRLYGFLDARLVELGGAEDDEGSDSPDFEE